MDYLSSKLGRQPNLIMDILPKPPKSVINFIQHSLASFAVIFEDNEDLLEIGQPAQDVILLAVIPFRNAIEFAYDKAPERSLFSILLAPVSI
jgi:hypothetical protein